MPTDSERTLSRSDTKYGDRLDNDQWDEPEPEPDGGDARARITDHELDVYYDADPDPEDNYDRERYTVAIRYDDETDDPYVLYAVEHRWKGNYWRDVTDWDWQDVPEPVRERVAAALPVESPTDLESGVRLIDAGGESRWEKHHKHRVESLSGDEMWGLSYLRDAMGNAETAAEAFEDDSAGERLSNKLVASIQKIIRAVDDSRETERGDA